ncbi:MAG: hypothetical protein LBS74_08405 [Oscillospiraceae bacterium]|nr:hypothetical protein [Oscillospiraceae bacterium]
MKKICFGLAFAVIFAGLFGCQKFRPKDIDYATVYDTVLSEWKAAVAERFGCFDDSGAYDPDRAYGSYPFIGYRPAVTDVMDMGFYYGCLDVNGDGVPELFIAASLPSVISSSFELVDVYTIRDNEPIRFFDSAYYWDVTMDKRLFLSKDGRAFVTYKGRSKEEYRFYSLGKDYKPHPIESLFYNASYNDKN